jgi:D-alanyl-D-alanine carboxypeptidase (penicillin-binding protein 5/6)
MLEGMLIGSASNYAARLAGNWWPSDASFASAANTWLDTHGVDDVTIVDPTGFDEGNTATPAGLVQLAQLAMANPTIAGIVAMPSVELPGAGTVKNTNTLLADAGTVGMKTGILDGFNVLAVKNLTVAGTTVQVDAVTLNQPDSKTRWATARDLFAQVERQLQPTAAVAAGATVGTATTEWGESVPVVAASDARLILWNGAVPSAAAKLSLGEDWTRGGKAGTVTATGPANTATVDAVLSRDVAGPGLWWRITHPLQLLGWD